MFYAWIYKMEPAAAATTAAALPSKHEKRERKHTAQSLPSGITQQMMKKYVVYYREFVNLANGKRVPREYFKVESHPKLSRSWVGTKSMKISLHEKLEAANQVVAGLEQNSASDATAADADPTAIPLTDMINKTLPKYTKLRVIQDNLVYSLVYDQKDNRNGFRWTCSHTFQVPSVSASASASPGITDAIISLELQHLKEKLQNKYVTHDFGYPMIMATPPQE